MHKVEQCDDGRARYDAVAYQLGAVWCDNTTLYIWAHNSRFPTRLYVCVYARLKTMHIRSRN